MIKNLKKRLKNQKGLTLIELLAVIVILGIIAAIAVPSIGGLIDNSKKDAHVANAQQMVSSAKLAVTSFPELQSGTKYITLEYLETAKYVDQIKDPDNTSYTKGEADQLTEVIAISSAPTSGSYVTVSEGKVTAVKLVNGTRGVQTSATNGAAVNVTGLDRDDVK